MPALAFLGIQGFGSEIQASWLLIPVGPQVWRWREEAEGRGDEQAVHLAP